MSKYYKFFQKRIILLAPEHKDLAERYNIPVFGQENYHPLTKAELSSIHTKTERQLEDYMNSLSPEDRDFVCSYWLGKCYEKDTNYINRGKIELLNRLSG